MKPASERAQPVYAVSELMLGLADQVVAAIAGTSVNLADLEVLLRRLLPTAPAQASPRIHEDRSHADTLNFDHAGTGTGVLGSDVLG